MMHLQEQGKTALGEEVDAIEPLDHHEFPQWPAAVHAARMQACGENAQLAPIARMWQGNMADVRLDVQIGIGNPVRIVETKGHFLHLLVEHRHQVCALAKHLHDVTQPHRAVRRRALRVEHQQADVHRCTRTLLSQEHPVQCRQLSHGCHPA